MPCRNFIAKFFICRIYKLFKVSPLDVCVRRLSCLGRRLCVIHTHTHRHTYINRGATSVWLCIIDLVTSKVPSPHTFNIHNSAFIGDEQAGPVT